MSDTPVSDFTMLFLINRFVDIVFFIDIFINMRLPYRDRRTGVLVLDSKAIIKRYLKSWFLVDLISVIPFEFITLSVGRGSDLEQLQLLRIIRLFRLLKLLRVFRASRKLHQVKLASGLRYATVELLKIAVILLFATHWIACGYRLVTDHSPAEQNGWRDSFLAEYNQTTASHFQEYSASLYWSSGIISVVGPQNDFLAPKADREFIFAAVANLFSYFLLIYFVAALTSVVVSTGKMKRKQEIQLDSYLKLFDKLDIDERFKYSVY